MCSQIVGLNYVGEQFDNIRILCLIYTMYGNGILWQMYTVHGIYIIRILCTIDCVLFLLSSSLFLKVHNQGLDILLLHSDWTKKQCIPPPLGDAQNMMTTNQMMISPSWLRLLSWSLVSRTFQCTQCFWQRLGKRVRGGGS